METQGLSENDLSRKLIQLVKEKPYLYDKDSDDYRDELKKTEGWIAVAKALGLGVEDTQTRWARLRVDFGRHRRKKQAAAISGIPNRDWPLYDLLTWLAPHVKMRAKREKRKKMKLSHSQTYKSPPVTVGYKPILPKPDWLVNVDGGVNVEVSPSIVMQSCHEDITESFIVSPDTADYDDDASGDNNLHYLYEEQGQETKLTQEQIEHFISAHDLPYEAFVEDLHSALGLEQGHRQQTYQYDIEGNHFIWKRCITGNIHVIRGKITVKKVPVVDTYEAIVASSREKIDRLEKLIADLKSDNTALKNERVEALKRVDEMATLKEDWERTLYGRFVAVLNAKKDRIVALQEAMDEDPDDDPKRKSPSLASTESPPREADPYGSDTELDSDPDDSTPPVGSGPAGPTAGTPSLRRRNSDIFANIDSPECPVPSLPKRTKMPTRNTAKHSPKKSPAKVPVKTSAESPESRVEDEPVFSGPSRDMFDTQQLLDEM